MLPSRSLAFVIVIIIIIISFKGPSCDNNTSVSLSYNQTLSLQAVKYLEGMLIQSQQAQKKEQKLSDDLDDLKLSESSGKVDKEVHQSPVKASAESLDVCTPSIVENLVKEEIVDQEEEQDKIEDAVVADQETKKTESLDTSKGLIKDSDGEKDKTKADQEEGMDLDKVPSDDKTGGGSVIDTVEQEEEEGDGDDEDDDDDQEEISIDPRTYCKLGHFHLLLEDYAKGEEEDDQDQKLLDMR